jgi:hypothetical protein
VNRSEQREHGSALLAATVAVTLVLSFMLAGMTLVTAKSNEVFSAVARCRGRFLPKPFG